MAANKTFKGVNYTRTYIVDRGYPTADSMTILVTITWTDQAGNPHTVSVPAVRRRSCIMKILKLNNKGFTLVELMVAVVILRTCFNGNINNIYRPAAQWIDSG